MFFGVVSGSTRVKSTTFFLGEIGRVNFMSRKGKIVKRKNGLKTIIAALVAVGFLSVLVAPSSLMAAGGGEWKKEWDDAKDKYKEITGKKKPKDQVKVLFVSFSKKSSGIDKALAKLDKVYKVARDKTDKKKVEKYRDALTAFEKNASKYEKVLKKGDDDPEAREFLTKTLDSIKTAAQGQLEVFDLKLKGGSTKEVMSAAAPKNMDGALKRAEKFISQIKAKPDLGDFNYGIGKAGRDVWMQLRFFVDNSEKMQLKKDPSDLYTALKPWGDQKMNLPKTASTNDVKDAIGVFDSKIQAARIWFDNEAF